MAVIRMEQVGYYNKRKQFDGIVESAADLPTGNETMEYNGGQYDPGPGSVFLCVAERSICIRTSDGRWPAVASVTEEAQDREEEAV